MSICDNKLTRGMASWLEHDYSKRPGSHLRKERPDPVLDDAARLHRTHYPLKQGDSKLRRLLLDPHCK